MTTPIDHAPLRSFSDLVPVASDVLDVAAVAGDWHANLSWAQRAVEVAAWHTRVILHTGDIGFWPDDTDGRQFLTDLTTTLERSGMWVLFTDGNHEQHTALNALGLDPSTGVRKMTSRIWHLPRAFRWSWNGNVWMAVGGAVSVDRDRLNEGVSWFAEEQITDADEVAATGGGAVDVMLTHDVPAGAFVPRMSVGVVPTDALADADAHRQRLRRVVDAVHPRHLWHGHYHRRYTDRIDLGWDERRPQDTGVLTVHGLDCDQGSLADNLALVNPDGAPHLYDQQQ